MKIDPINDDTFQPMSVYSRKMSLAHRRSVIRRVALECKYCQKSVTRKFALFQKAVKARSEDNSLNQVRLVEKKALKKKGSFPSVLSRAVEQLIRPI